MAGPGGKKTTAPRPTLVGNFGRTSQARAVTLTNAARTQAHGDKLTGTPAQIRSNVAIARKAGVNTNVGGFVTGGGKPPAKVVTKPVVKPVAVKPAAPAKTTTVPIKSQAGASTITLKLEYPSSPISNPDQGGGAGGVSPVSNGGTGLDWGRLATIGAIAAVAILLVIYMRKGKGRR